MGAVRVDEEVAASWKLDKHQTGVVVGYGAFDIVATFPTPPPEEGEALTADWVSSHCVQVQQMLVGGLYVRGLYVVEKNETWSDKHEFLDSCTKSIAEELENSGSMFHVTTGLLQFLVDPASDKYWCKQVFSQSANQIELEVKLQPSLLQQLHTFITSYSLSLTIPIWKEKNKTTLQDSLQPSIGLAVSGFHTNLRKAVAFVDGRSYNLGSLTEPTPISSSSQQHQVTLYTSAGGNVSAEDPKKGKGAVIGSVDIVGNLVGVAVCANTNVEEALDNIILDLCATLRTRLNLLCDSETLELPTRVVFRLPTKNSKNSKNSITLCDYVTAGESEAESSQRIQALLDLDLSKSSEGVILREDVSSVSQQTNQKQNNNNQKSQPSSSSSSSNNNNNNTSKDVKPAQSNNFFLILAAVVVAIIAIFILFLQQK